MPFQVGDAIGDYQVIGILGAGGMGQVYKVKNVLSDRVEAMKVLLPDLAHAPELADRFLREIKVQASLDHPNIAKLHTALRAGNQLVMVMELVEGTTLQQMLEKGPIPLADGLRYISDALEALRYAHERGVIHRDIKPANIMLTREGVTKLMDFGIAKAASDRKLTMTGTTMGSLYYMSPEQIRGAANLDPRSDLYSLGITLYEVVTGTRPFQGDSDYAIMSGHLEKAPTPPRAMDPSLPAALNEIILQAIAKDPGERFQSAAAFRAALDSVRRDLGFTPQAAAAAAPRPAPAPPPHEHGERPARSRRRWYVLAGAGLAAAVLIVAGIQVVNWRKTREGPAGPTAPLPLFSSEPSPGSAAPPAEPASGGSPPTPPAAPPAEPPPPGPAPAIPPASPAPAPKQGAPGRGAGTAPVAAQPAVPQEGPGAAASPPARQAPAQTPGRPAGTPASSQQAEPGPKPVAPPPRDAAALEELRERMVFLASRAVAVRNSISNLEQQQARMGLRLRPDMAAANERMDFLLKEAGAALAARDADAAKRNADLAERELEKLEKFLGR